jgi:DNA-directed RNA polymerase specialized sigma24 family protein
VARETGVDAFKAEEPRADESGMSAGVLLERDLELGELTRAFAGARDGRGSELAAEGRSNREIAQTLFVTVKTVELHLRNTYRKLDLSSRRELAARLRHSEPRH